MTITSVAGAAGNFASGGAWVGGVAPTAADDAVLDATTTSITLNTGSVCRSFDASAFTGTLTHNASVAFTIGDGTAGLGNMALNFGTFTYTFNVDTSTIVFVSSSGTQQTVNFNGKSTGPVNFSGGGSYKYTGGHTVTSASVSSVGLGTATLDINGQTCTWVYFAASNSNVRTLTLGAANITITGTGGIQAWAFATATNLTFNANTSTITFTGAAPQFNLGGKTFNNIVINGPTSWADGGFAAPTIANLTYIGTAGKSNTLSIANGSGTFTITGALTLTANSDINRILVQSSGAGSTKTLSCGSVVITNTVDFKDITATGAATWTIAGTGATMIGDCGGNTGITFTTPGSDVITMSTDKNWSDVSIHSLGRVPLPQDDVSMSGVTGGILTADMPRMGKAIDWTSATGTPTWAFSSTSTSLFGSLTLIPGMTLSGTQALAFEGRGTHTITSAGKSFTNQGNFTISCPGGSYSLNDSLSLASSSTFFINAGTFTSNNFTMNIWALSTSVTLTKVINPGSSNINIALTTTSTFWQLNSGTTYNGGLETITITATSANTRTFAGSSKTYGTLNYIISGSTGGLDITGSNSIVELNCYDASNARTLRFTAGNTTTIASAEGWNVYGSAGKLMTVSGITAANWTLSIASGIVSSNYLSLSYSLSTGGAAFFAGANSTRGTDNGGWMFTAPSNQRVDQKNYSGTLGVGWGDTGSSRDYMGQSFIPTLKSINAISFRLHAAKPATGHGYKVWIDNADSNGYPTGGIGGIGGATEISGDNMVIGSLTTFALASEVTLVPGQRYVVVFAPWNLSTHTWENNYFDWTSSISNPYASGRRVHGNGSYAGWNSPDSGNADIWFETYGSIDSSLPLLSLLGAQ